MDLKNQYRQENSPKLSVQKFRTEAWVMILMLVYLAIGLVIVTQYGESWDEHPRYDYAEHSLAAYTSGVTKGLADEKGPFYGMLALLGTQGLRLLFSGWKFIDGWHYMTFVSFVLGVYFFYRLCRRLIEPIPAFMATLLFSTQPVLWGHAFINPKDIPFMAFFLGSVALGLEMVDDSRRQPVAQETPASIRVFLTAIPQRLADEWRSASRRVRSTWLGLGLGLAIIVLSYRAVQAGLAGLVHQAYASSPSSLLGEVFARYSQHSAQIPAEAYIQKAQTLYSWLALSLGFLALLAFMWVGGKVLPSIFDRALVAGCFLGFASAIRTLGPATGVLVAVYFVAKAGRKAIPTLIKYLAVGSLSTFFFWPYLWSSPLKHYLTSLATAADFGWGNSILFAGRLYSEDNLPASYLPSLLGLQFTETVLAAILIGFLLALFYLWKKPALRLDLLLLGAWCMAPLAAAILNHSNVYDNFRQFLFVVPPLFVLSGLALQALWTRLRRKAWFALIGALLLLPGLYWDVQLHPYQYVYYNSLAGGTSGAYRNFELDYWCTSYKDAIDYLNQVAPRGSVIYVKGPNRIVETYARPDLTILADYVTPDPQKMPEYAIVSTREDYDQQIYPTSRAIFQVDRVGAVLAVVKQIRPGETATP